VQKHYEVIVLGRSIGCLAAASLLARRDFTVLLLGHGAQAAAYQAAGRTLQRRAFTFLTAASPAWRRIVVELAQSQTYKRRLVVAEPALQAIAPDRRFDIVTDAALFGREVGREFPELFRVVEELYGELGRVCAVADDVFDKDVMWPPGTFWERRETGRYASSLPYVHAEPDADILAEFPRGHFYRQLVRASVLFGTYLSSMPPPFAVARIHGAWTRGLARVEQGEDDLERFLVDRVHAHGGRCILGAKAAGLHLKRGVVSGVVIDGDEHPTGCDFVVTDLDGEALAALAGGQGIHKRALREWPRITSTVGRFVTSVVVRREGLPEPLGSEVLLFARENPWVSRDRPAVIHVQRVDQDADHTLLVAELLLPDHGALPLSEARAFVLRALEQELPFLENHLVLADSPHDALPTWIYEGSSRIMRPRSGLSPQEPMQRQLEVDPPGYLGLAGEPIRGPLERTLLVGRSVLPGLGQEGELLAAWSAARLISRSDKKKAMMRRDMWNKTELG
jgi:phytoene dehydrogenase-like protein